MEIYFRNWEDPRAVDHPERASRKGDVVTVKPDGHSDNPNWAQSQEANTDKLLMVKCPQLDDVVGRHYKKPWQTDLGYQILAARPNAGEYDVRVYEKVPGAAGHYNLTRDKIETFLDLWNCSNVSFGANHCDFMFRLWSAAKSVGFWKKERIVAGTTFTLMSYDGDMGIAVIRARVSASVRPKEPIPRILYRGGEMVSAEHPFYVFRLDRSVIFEAFKRDIRKNIRRPKQAMYRKHRYCVSQNVLDWILAQGNGPTVTLQQLRNFIIDKAAS